MSSLPPEIYDRVHEFSVAIVNASAAGDDALRDSLYQSLLQFHLDQMRAGQGHPFLTEAVADFTDDPAEATRLYRLSLDQARFHPEEPIHTKMICLAERLIELGQREQAEAFLRDGREEALRLEDDAEVQKADELQARCSNEGDV